MAVEVEDVLQSLEILLGTRLGERILQEDYGSSLIDYQFEEIRPSMVNRMKTMIQDAVLVHEPRVRVNRLEIAEDEAIAGKLLITLDVTIPANNSRYNLVYPFYLEEAT